MLRKLMAGVLSLVLLCGVAHAQLPPPVDFARIAPIWMSAIVVD
jgi:hypothetical protein